MINADTLRKRRTLAGLSQRKLSKLAGLSPLGIKRIEDGGNADELPLAVVIKIAAAVSVTIDELLTEPEPAPDPIGENEQQAEQLTFQYAHMLWRITRGNASTQNLTVTERELVVPYLVNRGLVQITRRGLECSTAVQRSLEFTPNLSDRRPPVEDFSKSQHEREI